MQEDNGNPRMAEELKSLDAQLSKLQELLRKQGDIPYQIHHLSLRWRIRKFLLARSYYHRMGDVFPWRKWLHELFGCTPCFCSPSRARIHAWRSAPVTTEFQPAEFFIGDARREYRELPLLTSFYRWPLIYECQDWLGYGEDWSFAAYISMTDTSDRKER